MKKRTGKNRPSGNKSVARAIHLHGLAKLARSLDISKQRLRYLAYDVKNGVPAEMAIAIEIATKGDVMRQEIRPDIFG